MKIKISPKTISKVKIISAYLLMMMGIVIVIFFSLQKLVIYVGAPCGEYNSSYAYMNDCTCFGYKEEICLNDDCSLFEIRCLGKIVSCKRNFFVHRISKTRDCDLPLNERLE